MVTLSSSVLPFKEYQWLISENSLEIFVVVGLVLVIIGWFLYRSWQSIERSNVQISRTSLHTQKEARINSLEELRNLIKETPLTDIARFKDLTLRAVQLKTALTINPKVPAREQILPVSAKNILIELERITYAKITTENDLEEFRTRLLKYLV